MKYAILKSVFFLVVFMVFSSCATILAPKEHPLHLYSVPDGAEVIMNGEKIGVTPLNLKLKADKLYTFELKKGGFEDYTTEVGTKVDGKWVVFDVFSGVLPLFVDLSTRRWLKLERESIHAHLKEIKKN